MKLLLALSVVLVVSPVFAAGVVVNDPAAAAAASKAEAKAEAQRLEDKIEKAKKNLKEASDFLLTLEQYRKVLEEYNKQLKAVTGIRDIGDIMVDIQSLKKDFMKDQLNSLDLNKMLNGSNGSPNEQADNIFNKYKLFAMCAGLNIIATTDCKQKNANKASTLESAQEVGLKLDAVLKNAEKLAALAQDAKDSKTSQDLNNAIGLRTIEMAALQTQLTMNVQQNQARDQLLEDKARVSFVKQQAMASAPTFN